MLPCLLDRPLLLPFSFRDFFPLYLYATCLPNGFYDVYINDKFFMSIEIIQQTNLYGYFYKATMHNQLDP